MDYELRIVVEKVASSSQEVVKRDTITSYALQCPTSICRVSIPTPVVPTIRPPQAMVACLAFSLSMQYLNMSLQGRGARTLDNRGYLVLSIRGDPFKQGVPARRYCISAGERRPSVTINCVSRIPNVLFLLTK